MYFEFKFYMPSTIACKNYHKFQGLSFKIIKSYFIVLYLNVNTYSLWHYIYILSL
jgi:hypothetical protein